MGMLLYYMTQDDILFLKLKYSDDILTGKFFSNVISKNKNLSLDIVKWLYSYSVTEYKQWSDGYVLNENILKYINGASVDSLLVKFKHNRISIGYTCLTSTLSLLIQYGIKTDYEMAIKILLHQFKLTENDIKAQIYQILINYNNEIIYSIK